MKLQQQVLNLYQNYHASPPRVLHLFGSNLGRYLLTIVVFCLVIVLSYTIQRPSLAVFALGLLIGALLRDLAVFIRFTKTWPITESVLNWNRIDVLLGKETR